MRVGNFHVISEEELQRLYRVFRPADLDEKAQLEGQITELQEQVASLEGDYDRAITAGDKAVDRADRSMRIRKAALLERKGHLEQIELLQQQIRDLTDAVQHPPEPEEKKQGESVVQSLLDQAQTRIGFADDLTTTAVQGYIERQLRLRGEESADSILAEVLAGGMTDEDETGEDKIQ